MVGVPGGPPSVLELTEVTRRAHPAPLVRSHIGPSRIDREAASRGHGAPRCQRRPGIRAYETVEFYSHTQEGRCVDDGYIGPAGEGLGWHNGCVYLHGRASSADVTVADEDRIHRIPVSRTGRWIFAARKREFDPQDAPANRLARPRRTSASAPERRDRADDPLLPTCGQVRRTTAGEVLRPPRVVRRAMGIAVLL